MLRKEKCTPPTPRFQSVPHLFVLFILIHIGFLVHICQGKAKILLHGEICNKEKDHILSTQRPSCAQLRLLHCTQPAGQTVATCTCDIDYLIWDPKAVRHEYPKGAVLSDTTKRSMKLDNRSILGSCRIRFGEDCNEHDDCVTGLKCIKKAGSDDGICSHVVT